MIDMNSSRFALLDSKRSTGLSDQSKIKFMNKRENTFNGFDTSISSGVSKLNSSFKDQI